MLSKVALWLRTSRTPFLQASILPVMLGGALARNQPGFTWRHFFLAIVGIGLIHSGTNLINEYYDHRSRADDLNPNRTPFSGGSGAIQDGVVPARQVFWAGIICFAAGGTIGIYFLLQVGWPVLALGIAGILGGYFYTAPPVKLGYRGLGEIGTGILLGPLAVLGGYVVHTGAFAWHVVWMSLPIGILVALILYINEFPDYEPDKAAGKRHLIVILGPKLARYLYVILLIALYVCLFWLLHSGLLPPRGRWLFLTLPLALGAIIINWRYFAGLKKMLPAQVLTIVLHLVFGLGMSAAVAFS